MGAFSVATGVTLLYDEGVLPPNPERQAVAFASPADLAKLGGEGLAMKQTATDLAMDDVSANGTVLLSSAALQFIVQSLATPEAVPKAPTSEPVGTQSGYPYSGWSQAYEAATHASSSATGSDETPSLQTPSASTAPAVTTSAASLAVASAMIDVLA